MRDVTLNQQEQSRIQVLNCVLEYQLPIAQAAEIMGVSERHTKRLLAAYRKGGPAALVHGNRGRKPHNAVPETVAAAVVRLASNGYAGANHSHFTELLREREGIDLSRPTVRRILVKASIGSPKVAAPSSTATGVGACPKRACWCRSTAASTARGAAGRTPHGTGVGPSGTRRPDGHTARRTAGARITTPARGETRGPGPAR